MGFRVEAKVTITKSEFHAGAWTADSPDDVIETLQTLLEAARAIWPDELKGFTIRKGAASRSQAGREGGDARAAVLSPERRSEIASAAAKARWGGHQ